LSEGRCGGTGHLLCLKGCLRTRSDCNSNTKDDCIKVVRNNGRKVCDCPGPVRKFVGQCIGIELDTGVMCGGTGSGMCNCSVRKRMDLCMGVDLASGVMCGGTGTGLCNCSVRKRKDLCVGVELDTGVMCGGTGSRYFYDIFLLQVL
jgi:hypothetical protein